MKQVIKRNGMPVPFDKQKIINAIYGAYYDVTGNDCVPDYAERIAEYIQTKVDETDKIFSVEEIQNLVEQQLAIYDFLVARSYIRYRYKHEVTRSFNVDFITSIKSKLMASDVQNQNANVDERSFGGRVGEASDEMMKRYALDFCMSKMARNNHLNNEIYIHKLNCA